MQISFSVMGAQQLSRNLRTAAGKLQNTKGFFSDALDVVQDKANKTFATKGGNLTQYNKWADLADSTKRARDNRSGYYKQAPNNPSTLRWTGKLQENVERQIGKDQGKITWKQPYAIYHQTGGGRLPQRAIAELDPKVSAEIVHILQKKINDDLGIAGSQF